jgi:hypothetical protein
MAEDLAKLLRERMGEGARIEIALGWKGWLRAFLRRGAARHDQALVDLAAEERRALGFAIWCWDALAGYSWRVAHAPAGSLCRVRARFYSAVSWGTHEKAAEGFLQPRSEHLNQLARWLGVF